MLKELINNIILICKHLYHSFNLSYLKKIEKQKRFLYYLAGRNYQVYMELKQGYNPRAYSEWSHKGVEEIL